MTILSQLPAIIYFSFTRRGAHFEVVPRLRLRELNRETSKSRRTFREVLVEMKQPLKIKSRMLVVDEVARFLRMHPTTIYRLIKSKKIPAFRVGSEWRFDREEVDRWIKTQQNIASSPIQKEKILL